MPARKVSPPYPAAEMKTLWCDIARQSTPRRRRATWFTMSRPRTTPLVGLPEGAKCCEGIISVSAANLPFRQRFTPGSTAWRKSYRRRNIVEGVNAFLKGGFVNIGQKFFRVFRLTKLTFLLAFTIAGYNVECIRSFNARKIVEAEAAEAKRQRRKKRRQGTWAHLLDRASADAGPDPPPG
jgi:hypothetical protein